jgi:tetratricopeptide (TPR) repeat protein
MWCAALLVLGAPCASASAPARPAARDVDLHVDVRVRSETLWDSGHADESLAYLDSVTAAGRARGDAGLVFAARLWRSRRMLTGGQRAATTALLDTLEREARALHAVEGSGWLLDHRARIANQVDARSSFQAWRATVRYAHDHHLRMLEGVARYNYGAVFNFVGRYTDAIREFRASAPLLPPESAIRTVLPLDHGLALNNLGRPEEARREYREGLDLCKKNGHPEFVRWYVNNLAVVEYNENDPGAALPYLEQALALPRMPGDSVRTQGFELSRAWTLYRIGPPERGIAELRALEPACEQTGDPGNLTTLHSYLCEAMSDEGEYAGSMAHARRALQFAAVASAESRTYAANSLARCQLRSGHAEDALATLDSVLADHPEQRRLSDLMDTQMVRIELLLHLGRLAEAEAAARAADSTARPDGPLKGANWQEIGALYARTLREQGQPNRAIAQLRRVRRDWERRRDSITREEWRENRGASAGTMFAEIGLSLLDAHRGVPERMRVREAFDALQEFQARTLEERMHGAGASARAMARRITLDSLQRSVLGPDQVLLDLVATPDTTFAFAVTRNEVRYRPLPGLRLLTPRVQRLMPAMEGAHGGAGPDAALAWMSAQVLAPFADLLASHPRLVVTGGGPLALLPWAALPGPDGRPLAAAHDVALAPSATLWAARPATARTPGTRLLVLGRTTDVGGKTLDGVRRECRAVQDYAGVTSRVHAGDRTKPELLAGLEQFDAIHFAAHMYSDNLNPWRSGVLVGKGSGDDAYLRASDIARRRLGARLVVLSGCQSAGVRSLPGEGPQGLASAFMCAGSSTVVATLWNVRDEVAADFMARFYAALAAGSGAARAARMAAMGMRDAGRGPGDWAAFVVWGAGDTRLPLKRRRAGG